MHSCIYICHSIIKYLLLIDTNYHLLFTVNTKSVGIFCSLHYQAIKPWHKPLWIFSSPNKKAQGEMWINAVLQRGNAPRAPHTQKVRRPKTFTRTSQKREAEITTNSNHITTMFTLKVIFRVCPWILVLESISLVHIQPLLLG